MNDLDTFANQFQKARRHGDFLGGQRRQPLELKRKPPVNDEWKKKTIERIWRESVPVEPGDPVHTYLTVTRGLPLPVIPADLHYHSALEYRIKEGERWVIVGKFPGMVAALRDIEGNLISIHRTYLTAGAKKLTYEYPNLKARLVLGGMNGAAIHLAPPDNRLLVGEGIETCLAASHIFKIPAWSAFSGSNLGNLILPASVEHLYIAVDNDESGNKASKKLAARARKEGKNVVFLHASKVVDRPGADWSDALEVMGEIAG